MRSDGTDLIYTTLTIPDTAAISTILYASATNVISALTTANSGVLVTSGTGVPSIATDIPTAVTIGTAYIYRVGGTDVAVADGGTGSSTAAGALTNLGLTATATELNYVDGVTSAIQTQIDTKAPTASPTFTTQIITPLVIGGTATTADLTLQTTSGIGEAGADMHFLVGNNGATEAITILNNGNVGIGTTGPGYKLDVVSPSGTGGIRLSQTIPGTGENMLAMFAAAGNTNNPRLELRADEANKNIILRADGSAGPNAVIFEDYSGNGLLTIKQNGNVGIGTTDPGTYKLKVAGNISMNAGNYLDWTNGSARIVESGYNLLFQTYTGSALTEKLRIQGSGNVGIGTTGPDRLLHVESSTALTNTVSYAARLSHITSGTPANSIGVGLEFEQETSASNNEIIATIEAIVTDVTATSENVDLVFKTMTAGAAAAERFRITSAGNLTATSIGGITEANLLDKTASETISGLYTIERAKLTTGDLGYQAIIYDTTAYNNSPLSGILFQIKYTSAGDAVHAGGIMVGKENATDTNYASFLSLHTRAQGGSIAEGIKIASDGGIYFQNLLQQTSTGLVVEYDTTTKEIYAETSSAAMKNNIRDFIYNTEDLLSLKPKEYTDKITGKREIGLIAEEVAELLPELVVFDKNNNPLGIKYHKLAVLLLNEIAQLKQQYA